MIATIGWLGVTIFTLVYLNMVTFVIAILMEDFPRTPHLKEHIANLALRRAIGIMLMVLAPATIALYVVWTILSLLWGPVCAIARAVAEATGLDE